MKVFEYLRNIYTGKNNLNNHISIFLLSGIMALCLNQKFESIFEGFINGYFGYSTSNEFLIYGSFVIGLVLFIFFTGYYYENIHNFYNDKKTLKDFSLSSFIIFVKMLPLFIVWGMYFSLFIAIGYIAFDMSNALFYLYFGILFCLPPFISIIYTIYAENFEYKIKYFNPLFLLSIINKCFIAIIRLIFELAILSILPIIFLQSVFKYNILIKNTETQLTIRLLTLCTSVYFTQILYYLFSQGLIDIIKNKLQKN